jgi:hypothetical protein
VGKAVPRRRAGPAAERPHGAGAGLAPPARIEARPARRAKEDPVATIGVALLVEEHRGEIAAAWRSAAGSLGGEPALAFALSPLLRELALALQGRGGSPAEAYGRIAVLVRSSARPAQLARELKLLHRAIWEALRASGEPVTAEERLAVDDWLHEALVECLERLERARARMEALDGPAAARVPPPRAAPPPLPARRNGPGTTH